MKITTNDNVQTLEYITVNGVKYKRVEESNRAKTLLSIARDWCDDESSPTVETLVDTIEKDWLMEKSTMTDDWGKGWNAYKRCLLGKLK